MTYTLITGSSKGIGKHIALECARLGMNLILVARSMPLLEELKQEIIKDVKVDVQLLSADLAKEGAAAEIYDWCARKQLSVDKLINNAGLSTWGTFENLSLSDKKHLIQLNVHALYEMTHYFLPDLLKQNEAYILNVGSTASYVPTPFMATYGGTKAFVYSFSRALRSELRKTSVTVSCLCPGPTKTNLAEAGGMKDAAGWQTMFEMSAESVARTAVLGMLNKKGAIVPGIANKFTVLLARIIPMGFMVNQTSAIFKNMGKSQ